MLPGRQRETFTRRFIVGELKDNKSKRKYTKRQRISEEKGEKMLQEESFDKYYAIFGEPWTISFLENRGHFSGEEAA